MKSVTMSEKLYGHSLGVHAQSFTVIRKSVCCEVLEIRYLVKSRNTPRTLSDKRIVWLHIFKSKALTKRFGSYCSISLCFCQ
jgi:hypothetical protein